jgi:hypothetical protein
MADDGKSILREAGLRLRINPGIFMGDNLRVERLDGKGQVRRRETAGRRE